MASTASLLTFGVCGARAFFSDVKEGNMNPGSRVFGMFDKLLGNIMTVVSQLAALLHVFASFPCPSNAKLGIQDWCPHEGRNKHKIPPYKLVLYHTEASMWPFHTHNVTWFASYPNLISADSMI